MAIRKNGRFIGKKGNTVSYLLNGQEVERTIGLRTSAATENELLNRERMRMVNCFLQPVKEVIKTGFSMQALKNKTTGYNMALSYNKIHGFIDCRDEVEMDFDKVLFSQGDMPVTSDVSVSHTANNLIFTWDGAALEKGMRRNDTIIMLAYCWEKHSAFFELSGARRSAGTDKMEVVAYHQPVNLEIYAAFMSTDRKSISNSVHIGKLKLEKGVH